MITNDELKKLTAPPIALPLVRGEEYRIVEADYITTPTLALSIEDRQKTEQALIRHPEWDSGEIDYMVTAVNLAPAISAELIEARAKIEALTAELQRAIDIYRDPAVTHANILNGRIALPKFYVNITDDFGPVADLRAALDAAINMNIEKNAEVVRLTAALAAANEDAARLQAAVDFIRESEEGGEK